MSLISNIRLIYRLRSQIEVKPNPYSDGPYGHRSFKHWQDYDWPLTCLLLDPASWDKLCTHDKTLSLSCCRWVFIWALWIFVLWKPLKNTHTYFEVMCIWLTLRHQKKMYTRMENIQHTVEQNLPYSSQVYSQFLAGWHRSIPFSVFKDFLAPVLSFYCSSVALWDS